MELKVRHCHSPKVFWTRPPMGHGKPRQVTCHSDNLRLTQPSDEWIAGFCRDCKWLNLFEAEAGQLHAEFDHLMGNKPALLGDDFNLDEYAQFHINEAYAEQDGII